MMNPDVTVNVIEFGTAILDTNPSEPESHMLRYYRGVTGRRWIGHTTVDREYYCSWDCMTDALADGSGVHTDADHGHVVDEFHADVDDPTPTAPYVMWEALDDERGELELLNGERHVNCMRCDERMWTHRVELADGRRSIPDMVQVAVEYLGGVDLDKFKAVFPEWAESDLSIEAYLDLDDTDPEMDSWMIEWIENNTTMRWDDGLWDEDPPS